MSPLARRFLTLACLLPLAACQSSRDDSDFPTLHPRERALYSTLTFQPDGPVIELAGLTRQRQTTTLDGMVIELRADREGLNLYEATLELRATDDSWSTQHRLLPRTSGRWQVDLAGSDLHHGWVHVDVEIESDPYWEMDQKRPGHRW